MDIPEIRIETNEIGIRDIPTWLKEPPEAIPPYVPVTETWRTYYQYSWLC